MAARARIQRTVVSGVSVAMIPSGANAPSWARVSIASRCAAADSQPSADTHGGDSPAWPKPITPVAVKTMVGRAEARKASHRPRQPSATSPPATFSGRGVHGGQREAGPDGHQCLGHHASGQGHPQPHPAWLFWPDQGTEHGEEPG